MPVTEPRSGTAELALKLCAVAAVVAAILVGVQRFTDGEQARAGLELRGRLFLARLEACRSLADTTYHLVAYADEPRFPEAVRDFQAGSAGPLELVADQALDQALADFNLSIGELQARRIEARELRHRADVLIRTCRCAVDRDTWMPEDGRPVSLPGACRGVPATGD